MNETVGVYCCEICGRIWIDSFSPFPFFEGKTFVTTDAEPFQCECVLTTIGEL